MVNTFAERQVAYFPLHLLVSGETERSLGPVGGVAAIVGGVLDRDIGEPIGSRVGVWVWRLAVPSLTRPPADRLRHCSCVVFAQRCLLAVCSSHEEWVLFY